MGAATRAKKPRGSATNLPVRAGTRFVARRSMNSVLLAPCRDSFLQISAAGLVGWLVAESADLSARAGTLMGIVQILLSQSKGFRDIYGVAWESHDTEVLHQGLKSCENAP